MSLERWVKVKSRTRLVERTGEGVRRFLNGAATEVEWHEAQRRYYVVLHGVSSDITGRLGVDFHLSERWIEVLVHGAKLSVLTRPGADQYTRCVADGLAKALATMLEGEVVE